MDDIVHGVKELDTTELSIFIWFLYKTTYKTQAFTVHFYISVSVDLGPFESCDQFDIAYFQSICFSCYYALAGSSLSITPKSLIQQILTEYILCLTIREEKDGGKKKNHAPHSTLTGPQVSSKVTNLIREILANYCADEGTWSRSAQTRHDFELNREKQVKAPLIA